MRNEAGQARRGGCAGRGGHSECDPVLPGGREGRHTRAHARHTPQTPSMVLPGEDGAGALYLGGFRAAINHAQLQSSNTRLVISAAHGRSPRQLHPRAALMDTGLDMFGRGWTEGIAATRRLGIEVLPLPWIDAPTFVCNLHAKSRPNDRRPCPERTFPAPWLPLSVCGAAAGRCSCTVRRHRCCNRCVGTLRRCRASRGRRRWWSRIWCGSSTSLRSRPWTTSARPGMRNACIFHMV